MMRLYDASEAGSDGYPTEWHKTIKHAVRDLADHRCVRCLHPYRNGEHGRGEWSPCDERCSHWGPSRFVGGDPIPRDQQMRDRGLIVAEGRPVESQWRILTVHHLDGDKLNCRWWNLASLCQRCHLTIQGRVVMARPYFLEHSEWFKPYAAGFYAFMRLGQELAREETMGRLDELLSLACVIENPAIQQDLLRSEVNG